MRYHMHMKRKCLIFVMLIITGCVANKWDNTSGMVQRVVKTDKYDIMTYQKITDEAAPVNIYIEGDGNAFTKRGIPTHNPTPNSTLVRDMADADAAPNVVYIARPCQYIMSENCTQSDWTDGRFSPDIISAMQDVVRQVAANRPVSVIGYSGGALISGLIIKNNPDINFIQWITVSGVLNHTDWTQHFGDKPLTKSMDLDSMPNIRQIHFVAENDKVVPRKLSEKWTNGHTMIVIPDASHSHFPGI